jgi:RimJ/RimL family protein N-acetyltransferase
VTVSDLPPELERHLRRAIGVWPPAPGTTVVENEVRGAPGWDGQLHPVWGLRVAAATVVGVPPRWPVGDDPEDFAAHLAQGIFRWTNTPAEVEPIGVWVPVTDPRLPPWLVPFGGDVLVAFDDDGAYAAGVGLKRHDDDVWEIAVGTDERHRGKGLARRIVALAAAAVLDAGKVPTYQHDLDNHASGKVADAAGFADQGWRFLTAADIPEHV